MEPGPTAILAAADFLALAVLRAARDQHRSIPDDLSVVVFDDNLPVQRADPPLTAIAQPNRRLGEEAGQMLVDRIQDPGGPVIQRLLMPTLIIRSSTGPRASAMDGEGRTTTVA
jgi:DNA-binding LacI/PurR family transcriptional regulator